MKICMLVANNKLSPVGNRHACSVQLNAVACSVQLNAVACSLQPDNEHGFSIQRGQA